MKKIFFVLLTASLIISCKADTSEIEARIDTLEKVSIASIQAQLTQMSTTLGTLQSTQAQLSGYVSTLQTSVGTLEGNYSSIQSAVTGLQQKDQAFERNLQDLQTAIGDSANDVKQWVESSYATLQQFNQVQTDITGIKTDIQSIFSRLDGLDQTTQTIANNLRDATEDLTGKLGKCQEDIAGILEDLEALQGDMDTVKQQIAAIISAVQSVVVVPDYSDGSVKMTDGANNIIRFEVFPLEAAENLASLGVSALSLDYVVTETKADALTNIPLTAVSFDGEFLNVTADGTGLKDEVKDGTAGANARLRISDGTAERSSEYFSLLVLLSYQDTFEYVAGDAIDLGLSVDWSNTNLGAIQPEEYGAYFAFGETETKANYSWATYKWCNGSEDILTKYNTNNSYGTVDNKTMLDPEDDVALVKLGNGWRLPTEAEWGELKSKCTWTWIIQNGIHGFKVTASNGNSIFLPAAGYRDGTRLVYPEIELYYWTSLLDTGNPLRARGTHYTSDYFYTSLCQRYYGHSVRPIYDTVQEASVKEVFEGADDEYYRVTGVVTKIHGAHYGNMYINDGTVEDPGLEIYGSRDKLGNKMASNTPYDCFNDSHNNSWTIGLGDVVTLKGTKKTYNQRVELFDDTIIRILPSLLAADQTSFEIGPENASVQVNFTVKGGPLNFFTENDWLHVSNISSNGDLTIATITVDFNPNPINREGEIMFSSSDDERTSKIAVIVHQGRNAPGLMTIAEALQGSYVHIQGTVMAICARGYVLSDATGSILAYYGSKFDATKYKIGDEIELIGDISAYNYGPQLSCDGKDGFDLEEKKSEGSGTVTYPTPKVIDQEALATLIASINGKERNKVSDAIKMEYVQIVGTPIKDGYYTNIFLDDYTTADFAAYQLPSSFDLASMLDKKVTIRGYVQSISSSKHVNIVFTEMVEGEAEVPTIEYTDLSTLLPLAANTEFELTAIVAFVTSRKDAAIVTDGTNFFYLYKPATMPAVGDIVTASGKISPYNHLHESAQGPTITVIESGATLPELSPKDITSTYGTFISSQDPHPADYITAVGTYVVDGNYTNLVVEGSDTVKGSLNGNIHAAWNGKKVQVTGWFIGSNKMGTFIYTDVTNIEAVN